MCSFYQGILRALRRGAVEPWTLTPPDIQLLDQAIGIRRLLSGIMGIPEILLAELGVSAVSGDGTGTLWSTDIYFRCLTADIYFDGF